MSGRNLVEYTDANLVRMVRDGDIAAFETLFGRYQKRAYNIIYRMVGNEQDAADLTQEVFIRIYNSRHLLKSEEAFTGWMRTIAVNLCRDHFRKKGRSIKTESLDEPISYDGGEIEREVEDWSYDPGRVLDKKDLQETVQRVLGTLSDEHRTVVVLHHIEGMDVKDIAGSLGVPEGTVKSRLSRARDEMKRKLGHYVS